MANLTKEHLEKIKKFAGDILQEAVRQTDQTINDAHAHLASTITSLLAKELPAGTRLDLTTNGEPTLRLFLENAEPDGSMDLLQVIAISNECSAADRAAGAMLHCRNPLGGTKTFGLEEIFHISDLCSLADTIINKLISQTPPLKP